MKKFFILFTCLLVYFLIPWNAVARLNAANEGGRDGNGAVIMSPVACPGAAVSVYEETGVTNSANILGQPNGDMAIFKYNDGSQITLDITGDANILPVGTTVTIHWRKNSATNPLIDLRTQNDIDPSWTDIALAYAVTNETLAEYSFTTTSETRYLEISVEGTSIEESEILEIDAITYTCPCLAPTPAVEVENYCGYTVLTASGYEGDLTWSTGETTPSITITTGGLYFVSQKVGDCLSLSGRATAAPYMIPANPGTITGPANPCESTEAVYSINTVNGATGYFWTVPEGWTIKSGQNSVSITVTVGTGGGNVSVKATTATCESPESSVLAVSPDLVCCTITAADRYEPNNTLQTATVLTVGGSLIWANVMNPKDADWYSFTTDAAGSYTVNLTGAGESLALYNDLGRKLKATDRTGTTYNLLNTTYYIKVSSRLKAPVSCYSLGVSFVMPNSFVREEYDISPSASVQLLPEGICQIWPNPSTSEFNFQNGKKYQVQVRVIDFTGRTVEVIGNIGTGQTVRFGKNYIQGVYLVEITGNGIRETQKVIKQ